MDFGKLSLSKFFGLWSLIGFVGLIFFQGNLGFYRIVVGFFVSFFAQSVIVIIRIFIARANTKQKFYKQTILSYFSFFVDFCIISIFFFLEESNFLLIGFFIAFVAYISNLVIMTFFGITRKNISKNV